jgi:hypothetical protein
MQSLRFVANAIAHAESLADEAADLNLQNIAQDIWKKSLDMSRFLDKAILSLESIKPARTLRERALKRLGTVCANASCQLKAELQPKDVHRFCPGGNLNMAERVRFILRRIEEYQQSEGALPCFLQDVRADLSGALHQYEISVDQYLVSLGQAQEKKSIAILQSQQLRLQLEKAKYQLLQAAEAGSPAWCRIKKRTVRTKRAQWLEKMVLSNEPISKDRPV